VRAATRSRVGVEAEDVPLAQRCPTLSSLSNAASTLRRGRPNAKASTRSPPQRLEVGIAQRADHGSPAVDQRAPPGNGTSGPATRTDARSTRPPIEATRRRRRARTGSRDGGRHAGSCQADRAPQLVAQFRESRREGPQLADLLRLERQIECARFVVAAAAAWEPRSGTPVGEMLAAHAGPRHRWSSA